MNVMVISASMRSNSQSRKVADYLTTTLQKKGTNAWTCDLHSLGMPLFDDGETEFSSKNELLAQLNDAQAYVFVSPEWNGMMSHGLINMLHFVSHEMAHKPVMLVGVSSGRGGTYPISQMKQLGQKNNHYVISPENLIVSDVKNMLNTLEIVEADQDYQLKKRALYALDVLLIYAHALEQVRTSPTINFEEFGNGV